MTHMPTVKSVMTPFPYSLAWEDSVEQAVQMMEEHDIRHLPITRAGELYGLLSDSDLRVSRALTGHGSPGLELQVGLICTTPPYVVDLDTTVPEVSDEMAARQIGSALVTRGGQLCGIVTTTDICRYLADRLRREFPPTPPTSAA